MYKRQGKELLLLVISDTSNTETHKKEKKTYTVEEIAEQLCVSKKVAYEMCIRDRNKKVRTMKVGTHKKSVLLLWAVLLARDVYKRQPAIFASGT